MPVVRYREIPNTAGHELKPVRYVTYGKCGHKGKGGRKGGKGK